MHHPGFDIRSHAFTRTVRGVDEAEVEAALHAAAPAYEEARAILQELQQALAETLAERERLLEGERSVIKMIRSAEEHARMRISTAHRDAARVVERAEEQARELLAGAEAQRATVLGEIEAIVRRRHHLVATVSGFVEAMAAKPSTAFVPDALATFSQSTADPAWAPLVEQEQEDIASSLSWASDSDEAVAEESLEPFPSTEALADETSDLADLDDLEAAPELTTASSVDDEVESQHWWARFGTRRALTAAAAIVLLAAAVAFPAVRGWNGPSSPSRAASQSSPVLAASVVPDPATAEPAQDPAATPTAPLAPGANPFADAPSPLAIKLTSTRSCWVGITVDGKTDSVLLEPGDELERSGSKQIRLRIGDAGAATLAVNGQALPPLGRNGEVVDRTFNAEAVSR
jgi:cell division septum initiation protein DivIVA